MKQQEVLTTIINNNGIKHQAMVAIEELAELTKELTKLIRDKGSNMKICEEVADVEICLEQIKMYIPRARIQVKLFRQFKIKRLEKLYIEGYEK